MNKSFLNTPEDAISGVVNIPPEVSRYSTNDCFLETEQEFINITNVINITNGNIYVYLFGVFNSRTDLGGLFHSGPFFLLNVTLFLDFLLIKDCVTNNFGCKSTVFCKNNEL